MIGAGNDPVDSMPTLLGGRMLGHHVAFRPSRASGGYGGFYGAADTSKKWRVTNDGRVWTVQGVLTILVFDGMNKLVYGDPDAWYSFMPASTYQTEEGKRELAATTIDSRNAYADAEARARSIIAGGQAALQQAALAPAVAPQYNVQSGSELVNVYAEKDAAKLAAAATDAALATAGKKPAKKRRKPAPKSIPTWVWAAGGGAVLLLIVGGVALSRRRQITG